MSALTTPSTPTLDYSNKPIARDPRSIGWLDLAALVFIFALSLFTRFIWLGSTEAHFDELWHMELSTGRGSAHDDLPHDVIIENAPDVTSLKGAPGWPNVWTHLNSVTHPPLYPLMLRFWREAFGESIVVARAMSAICGALSVLVLFDVSRFLVGTKLSLWAAAIFALSSAQVDMSQEVRNYTLATLAVLLAADALVRIHLLGATRRRAIFLTLATTMALLSHYFVAPVLTALGLFALIAMRGRSRTVTVIALLAGLAIFFAIWGPMMPRQWPAIVGASEQGSLGDPSAEPMKLTWQRLATLPLRQLFEPRDAMILPSLGSAALYFLPWIFVFAEWKREKQERNSTMLFWALWITLAALFPGMLDLLRKTRHLEELRHTIFAGPAVVGILVSIGARQRWFIKFALPILVTLACAAALQLTYTRQNPEYSYMGRLVSDPKYAAIPIVFYSDPNMLWWSDLLFMGAGHYSGTFPRTVLRLSKPATPELIEQLHRWPRLWCVVGAAKIGPKELLPGCEEISMLAEPHLGRVSLVRWRDEATK